MEPSNTDVAELMGRVSAMRAAIGRMQGELDALIAAEAALGEKLRAMGLDDAQTTVDLPTIPGLPSRRKRGSSAPEAPAARSNMSPVKAAAIGAGFTLGIALLVLLAVNIQVSRRAEPNALASAVPTVSGLVIMSPTSTIPPPEPIVSAAPSASADIKPEMGALTIVCTPRCDTIVDNGTPLSPGNLVAVPVAAGPHKIVVTGNGTKKSFSITIAPGQTKDVRASLENLPVDRGF